MKYRFGDKIKIRPKEWFDTQDIDHWCYLYDSHDYYHLFRDRMDELCGKIFEIRYAHHGQYCVDGYEFDCYIEDWMIECAIEDNVIPDITKHAISRQKFSKIGSIIY